MTAPDEARMTLADDEQADLRILLSRFSIYGATVDDVLAHVAYRAQGYVMGDLAHDGTLRAQGEAGE